MENKNYMQVNWELTVGKDPETLNNGMQKFYAYTSKKKKDATDPKDRIYFGIDVLTNNHAQVVKGDKVTVAGNFSFGEYVNKQNETVKSFTVFADSVLVQQKDSSAYQVSGTTPFNDTQPDVGF